MADRLAAALGLAAGRLWIKRDDLLGLAGGGNKARKLEFSVGAAVTANADVLVTGGAAQSNHVRMTAAAGARLGLDVVAVMTSDPPSRAEGNVLLETMFD
ncbi:MAG: pyridoxal-phosphate dependent enzyme, partial [Actinomycetota bacterium]|nr:pyridoxal-phosphate dependent enzyme [Actinomycetota bacterium]